MAYPVFSRRIKRNAQSQKSRKCGEGNETFKLKWFIEGDIKDCFNDVDHTVLNQTAVLQN
jgi:retron-type reverse transcriptase